MSVLTSDGSERSAGLETTTVPARGRVARIRHVLWRSRWPLLFVSPWVILFLVFAVWPYAFAGWLSLVEWKGASPAQFVGLDNFARVMRDERFWGSMLNTGVMFLLYLPATIVLSLVLANVLNTKFVRLKGLWLALLVLPNATAGVAIAYTFGLIFEERSGIANQLLLGLGLNPVAWISEVWPARIAVSVIVIWGALGFATLIALAGLQSIPAEVVEAAKVDGASTNQAFWHVTVPMLKPVIIFQVTLSLIGMLELYTEPFILTKGGPMAATETPAMRIFDTMLKQARYGYAAALGLVGLLVVIVITLAQLRVASRGGWNR